jgi:hypothetical protein
MGGIYKHDFRAQPSAPWCGLVAPWVNMIGKPWYHNRSYGNFPVEETVILSINFCITDISKDMFLDQSGLNRKQQDLIS